jgi:hypothetical protein
MRSWSRWAAVARRKPASTSSVWIPTWVQGLAVAIIPRHAARRGPTRGRYGSASSNAAVSGWRTRVRDPAGHLRATLRNPFVVGALQASQGLGRDWIPLRSAGGRWIPWPVAKVWPITGHSYRTAAPISSSAASRSGRPAGAARCAGASRGGWEWRACGPTARGGPRAGPDRERPRVPEAQRQRLGVGGT